LTDDAVFPFGVSAGSVLGRGGVNARFIMEADERAKEPALSLGANDAGSEWVQEIVD